MIFNFTEPFAFLGDFSIFKNKNLYTTLLNLNDAIQDKLQHDQQHGLKHPHKDVSS